MKDLAIIGYGAAGFSALIRANELGIKPVLIGKGEIGGTCVNVGCVPSKKVLWIGGVYNYAKKACGEGCYPDFFNAFIKKEETVKQLKKAKYEDVLSYYDVELINGEAHFVSPFGVKVNNKLIEAKKYIIATGSSPIIPEIKGLREAGFWTNVEALSPRKKVESLIIIGGRALALEFAQMYRRLGVEVALIQRSPLLIPNYEPEVSLKAREILEREGIYVITRAEVKEVLRKGETKIVKTNKGDIEGEEILIATGRKPNTDIGLEKAGVELNERGGIKVNEELRTTNENIFAAGDVIGGPMLESLAGKEGSVACENAIKGTHKKIDFLSVPQVIFTQPNIAKVGLTQEEAEANYETSSRIVYMKDIAKANIIEETEGLIKMVIERNTKKILGVNIISEHASEIINEASLAIKLRATIDDIIDTVHVFPTMSESLKMVSLSFYRDITKMSCCVD